MSGRSIDALMKSTFPANVLASASIFGISSWQCGHGGDQNTTTVGVPSIDARSTSPLPSSAGPESSGAASPAACSAVAVLSLGASHADDCAEHAPATVVVASPPAD